MAVLAKWGKDTGPAMDGIRIFGILFRSFYDDPRHDHRPLDFTFIGCSEL